MSPQPGTPFMEPYRHHVLVCTGGFCAPDRRGRALYALLASLLQYVDQAEIRTTQGTNSQFNYRLTPLATITEPPEGGVAASARGWAWLTRSARPLLRSTARTTAGTAPAPSTRPSPPFR